MAIPTHRYHDETVMRQAFADIPAAVRSPLIPTIIKALSRRVGSRLLPGVTVPRTKTRNRRG